MCLMLTQILVKKNPKMMLVLPVVVHFLINAGLLVDLNLLDK